MDKKYLKNNKHLLIVIFLLVILIIITGVFTIKTYCDAQQYKKDADYSYNLYLQGINDEEQNMYQDWIDNLGTDELSAYEQGYSAGISEGQEIESSESYDDGYTNGYNEAKSDYYNKVIYTLLVLIILNFIIMISISHKISKMIERN